MECVWERQARVELVLWRRLADFTGLRCVQPLALRWFGSWDFRGSVRTAEAPGKYRKVLAVLKQVEVELQRGSVSSFLDTIERFAMNSEGTWLKVGGGEKGEVLEHATRTAPLRAGVVAVEFGAFIGYTASRLSAILRNMLGTRAKPSEARVLTVEGDPIHCVIARHFVDLVHAAAVVEVQPGMVHDVVPLAAEAFGQHSVAFAFMDQKGTSFHIDLALLDSLVVWPKGATIVADNVLRPGAPVYNWVVANAASVIEHVFWSLPEFLEEKDGVEDWMAIARILHLTCAPAREPLTPAAF